MHLFDSVFKLLQLLRDSYDLYCYTCKQQNKIAIRFQDIPHEVITFLLYNIQFEKSKICDLEFLFLEFIRLGYNPFRKDASYKESVMVKGIVAVIDKQRSYKDYKENKRLTNLKKKNHGRQIQSQNQ